MSDLNEKTKYSGAELQEFEDLINSKLEVARAELKSYKGTLTGAEDESENKFKSMEDGAISAERESMTQLAARQSKYIQNLEYALMRIKNGTYGICSVTGILIPRERLLAVPHTTQSMEAKKANN
jgi:RNA polymerase-binding transcription factor DksA